MCQDRLKPEIALLLDAISLDPERLTADRVASLSPGQWQTLIAAASYQRVSGLPASRLKVRHLDTNAPGDILATLRHAERRTAKNNLRLYGDLRRVVAALQDRGIQVMVDFQRKAIINGP